MYDEEMPTPKRNRNHDEENSRNTEALRKVVHNLDQGVQANFFPCSTLASMIPQSSRPHRAPGLNPLDYSVWSILEEKACAKPHPTVESLKRALKKAWKEISLDTLIKIVDNFPKRLKACIEANGDIF
uniref:HMG box domain-containing protein n=1 Tax=Acrobeloides nanus TaxID=290746 RepID=A0A914E175_9BILA